MTLHDPLDLLERFACRQTPGTTEGGMDELLVILEMVANGELEPYEPTVDFALNDAYFQLNSST